MRKGFGTLVAVAIVMLTATAALAYIEGDGKGKPEADCFVGLDGYDPGDLTPYGKKGKPAIQCTDCDPSCDLDGVAEANGSCTFSIAVRVNDAGDALCTPAQLKKVTAKAKTKGTKITSKTSFQVSLDGSSATSAFVNFPVLVKKFGTPKEKPGTGKVSMSAKKLEKPKLSDKDKFIFVCNPLPAGQVCPVSSTTSTTLGTTTTSVTSTTTTTLETTTTSVTSTTTTTTLETTTTSVTSTTTTTIGPVCGDGVINQPTEECDGTDLGGAECPGSATGAFPACTGECLLDFTPCEGGSTTSTTTTTLATTSTTIPTTTTTIATTTTTTTTSSTSSSTTTTTSSSTTTTLVGVATFRTGPAGSTCGESRTGGSGGTILKSLTCGGLNIGGGGSTVPEGPTPSNAPTQFSASCDGTTCTLGSRTSTDTGSNTNCSAPGCKFGTFLSIANGGLSTCVNNTFAMGGSGTIDLSSGAFDGSVPLQSEVSVTGNAAAPCPRCLVGGVPGQGAGVCSTAATNSGAACTGVNSTGDTYDCIPGGVLLAPFGVDLTPIGTGTQSKSGPTFCPGQDASAPGLNGCFGNPTCDYIEERGANATGIAPGGGPTSATLASVFCIPATGNGLIDGAADLPGPGAISLPGTLDISPL